jgi:hypothetical protein
VACYWYGLGTQAETLDRGGACGEVGSMVGTVVGNKEKSFGGTWVGNKDGVLGGTTVGNKGESFRGTGVRILSRWWK